jgi:hypothetical protein
VNGAEIRRGDVEAEAREVRARVSLHGDVDEARQQAFRRRSLQNLIDAELAYQAARARGVEVSDAEVEQALSALSAKYPDREVFEERLRSAGIEREDLEADLRRERMIAKIRRHVGRSGREIGEEEVRRHYEENRARFQQPRRAVVRRIFVLVPPLGRSPEVWQAALDEATAARARIEAGEPFERLVTEISDVSDAEKRSGGLLGTVSAGRLEPALDAALWSTPEGGVSAPVRTFKGIYLLKVERFVASRPIAYEQARKQLRANLERELSRELVEDWLAGLRAEAEIEILDASLASPPAAPTRSAEEAEPQP